MISILVVLIIWKTRYLTSASVAWRRRIVIIDDTTISTATKKRELEPIQCRYTAVFDDNMNAKANDNQQDELSSSATIQHDEEDPYRLVKRER